jgi:predicted GIY-YIG superfamily endonuclease
MQIYVLEAENINLYKVGVSKDTKKRIKQIQTGCPFKLKVLLTFDSKYAFKIETNLHRRFKVFEKKEYNGMELSGEWFALDKENLDSFIDLCKSSHNAFDALENSDNPFF